MLTCTSCLFYSLWFWVGSVDDYNQMIADEKSNQADIQGKIRSIEKEIRGQHREMGGVHASAQHTQKTQKAIRVKENRLHQVLEGFHVGFSFGRLGVWLSYGSGAIL